MKGIPNSRKIISEDSILGLSLRPKDLVEHCDGSESAIYRRIEVLTNLGILITKMKIDADGYHYREFKTECDKVDVTLEPQSINVEYAGNDKTV